MIPAAVAAEVRLPFGLSLFICVYLLFQPLKGKGLLAIFIMKVSFGSKFLIEVDFPVPESAIPKKH